MHNSTLAKSRHLVIWVLALPLFCCQTLSKFFNLFASSASVK